jgi:hypothetical protein
MSDVTIVQADRDAAEDAVSAANIVSHDGYYEADIDKVAEAFARHRQASTEDLVEALRQAEADFEDHAQHAQNRIDDGEELGARVWRIALEEIVREALQNKERARTALNKAGAL